MQMARRQSQHILHQVRSSNPLTFRTHTITGMLIPIKRFLLVVSGIYKQVRNQSATMMSDIGEDNFDRAFEAIRPGKLPLYRLIIRV